MEVCVRYTSICKTQKIKKKYLVNKYTSLISGANGGLSRSQGRPDRPQALNVAGERQKRHHEVTADRNDVPGIVDNLDQRRRRQNKGT